jgi:hypothetical protein
MSSRRLRDSDARVPTVAVLMPNPNTDSAGISPTGVEVVDPPDSKTLAPLLLRADTGSAPYLL